MSEPEIARRCPVCGASIRERAFFCPQCGSEFAPDDSDGLLIEEGADPRGEILRQTTADRADSANEQGEQRPRIGGKERKTDDAVAAQKRRGAESVASAGGGDRIHRATTTARDVIEDNVLQRVEKLRKVSSVVLDQAAYDPSLRFLLVAAGLFLLFLLILFLSKLIG